MSSLVFVAFFVVPGVLVTTGLPSQKAERGAGYYEISFDVNLLQPIQLNPVDIASGALPTGLCLPGPVRYTVPMKPADSFVTEHPTGAGPGRTRVLSVSSLNHMARSLLEGHFPAVLVEGEISNFSTPSSGHWYLTLKDEKSQLRCAMFRNSNRRVRFRPENGLRVLVKGRLSLYEARGDYQLIADDMEEAGDGALRRAFEALKAKLADEGLFDDALKKPVPRHCRHVAIVTSPTGAAIRDLLTVFRRRFPAIRLTLLPVAVQGREAPAELVSAIARANRLAEHSGFDALLLARGGGSLEDLQAFNDESVARAIHASQLPVVCGVGHEIDYSIADLVADLRAPTPSAAAELLSPDLQDILATLGGRRQQLAAAMIRALKQANQKVHWLTRQLKHPGRRLQEYAQTLDLLEGRLKRSLHWQFQRRRTVLSELHRTLLSRSPRQQILSMQRTGRTLKERLHRIMHVALRERQKSLNQLVRNMNAVNPLNTLARGFSITYRDDDTLLRDAKNLAVGDRLVTKLHRGTIESEVINTQPDTGKQNPDLGSSD